MNQRFLRGKLNMEALSQMCLIKEGGYANYPNDPGGPTNMGVTLATFITMIKLGIIKGYSPDVNSLKRLTIPDHSHILEWFIPDYARKWPAPATILVWHMYWGSGQPNYFLDKIGSDAKRILDDHVNKTDLEISRVIGGMYALFMMHYARIIHNPDFAMFCCGWTIFNLSLIDLFQTGIWTRYGKSVKFI